MIVPVSNLRTVDGVARQHPVAMLMRQLHQLDAKAADDFVVEASDMVAKTFKQISTTVTLVESLGHERHVLCRLDGSDDLVIVRLAAEEAAPRDLEHVRLTARPGGLHLFDATTGARLGG